MNVNKNSRYLFIDNIRLLMIIIVLITHAAAIYSGIGEFYYTEAKLENLEIVFRTILSFFLQFTQAYYMGILFFIAGYFVPGAYKRKGFARFIKDRIIRLGMPTLIYMLLVNPFISQYILNSKHKRVKISIFHFYLDYIQSRDFLSSMGPLWFALALLIFSIVYATGYKFYKKEISNDYKIIDMNLKNALLLILIISIFSFIVRITQPIAIIVPQGGSSILNFNWCFFAQYIILFIVGIKSYSNNLFDKISYCFGEKCLIVGLIFSFPLWRIIMKESVLFGGVGNFIGGLNWFNVTYTLWESFVCVTILIGLLSGFREKFNYQNNIVKVLSENAFAVYVFHPPILLFISICMRNDLLPPQMKFLRLCVIGIPICFIISIYILQKIPLIKNIL